MPRPIESFDNNDASSDDDNPHNGPRMFRGNRPPLSHYYTTRLPNCESNIILGLDLAISPNAASSAAAQGANRYSFTTSNYLRTAGPLAHIKGSRVNMSPAQLLGTVPANSFRTLGAEVEAVEQHTTHEAHWRVVAPPDTIQSKNVTIRWTQAAESTDTNVNRQAGVVAANAATRERARAAIRVARQALEDLRAFGARVAAQADEAIEALDDIDLENDI
jgi:hypothetical protein